MSSLGADASREEIEEEIDFVGALVESLDEYAEDAAEKKTEFDAQLEDLHQRLEASNKPASDARPITPQPEAEGLTGSIDARDLPSRERRQTSTIDNFSKSYDAWCSDILTDTARRRYRYASRLSSASLTKPEQARSCEHILELL